MNNKISNPQVEVLKSTKMNDCDYLNTMLEIEKNMSNNLSIALNEASCQRNFDFEFSLFQETKMLAREIYNMMFDCGWYSLEKAELTKINETINELDPKINELI